MRPLWLHPTLIAALGCISIACPLGLHLLVSKAITKRLSRAIETYTGGDVTIQAAWPVGLKSPGIKAENIDIRLHNDSPDRIKKSSIFIPSIRGRLHFGSLNTITITVENPRIRASGDIEELSGLLNRHPRSPSAKTRSSGRNANILVRNLNADLVVHNGPVTRIVADEAHLVLEKCKSRNRTCHRATVGSLKAVFKNGGEVSGKNLSWKSFSSPKKTAELQPISDSKTETMIGFRGFQLDRLNARVLNVRLPGNLGRFSLGPALAENNLIASFILEEPGEDLLDMTATAYIADGAGGRVRVKGIKDLRTGQTGIQADFTNMTARILTLEKGIPGANDKTIVNGRITASLGPGNEGSARFDLNMDADTELFQRRIARTPVQIRNFDVMLKGNAHWKDSVKTVDFREMRVRKDDVSAGIRGRIRFDEKGVGCALEAVLEETPCQRLLDVIPAEIIPALDGMILSGNLGAKISISAHSKNLEDLSLAISSNGGCSVEKDPPGADANLLLRPYTMQVKTAEGTTQEWILGEENPYYRSLERLPNHLVNAFLTTEDREFFSHKGFDIEQIRRALAFNVEHRGFYKGASTISQQLVKNVFLNHDRNVSRKLQEALLTWRLEQVVPKNRILELYLNLIEMGPGIYGVDHASRVYFNRPAGRLVPLQSLHLAAITPSPVRYYKTFKGGRITMDWLLHLRNLLAQMRRQGHISNYVYREWINSELIIAAY